MAAWPETIVPNYSLILTPKWQTLKTPLGERNEQRTAKQTYPQFDVTVAFNTFPSHSDVMTIWDFFIARKGSYEGFDIYDPRLHGAVYPAHLGLLVGVGDGSTDIFDIPGRSTSSQSIYLDGVSQGSGWSILTGGGRSSSDRVDFTTAPTTGEIITTDFTGIMRIRVRFASDLLSFELFEANLWRTGAIQLYGLKFA